MSSEIFTAFLYNLVMKELFKDPEIKKRIFVLSISGIVIFLFAILILNIKTVGSTFSNFLKVMSSFLWGIFFAFLMLRFAKWVENKIFNNRLKPKTRRTLSSIIAMIVLIIILVLLGLFIVPQLGDSIAELSKLILDFTSNASTWIANIERNTRIPSVIIEKIYELSNTLVSSIWQFLQENISSIVNVTVDAVTGVMNFVIGLIVAIYILIERDELKVFFKKIFRVIFSDKSYDRFIDIYHLSVEKFYKFLSGKVIDTIFVFIICMLFMLITKLNYPVLISVIIALTNLIPFFGPFIGTIPSALILLIIDPFEALVFVIFIIILQQIEGNILEPKILGDSVGLSSLWIMFAIIFGGAYFGLFGMLLGVPIFSVIYYFFNEYIDVKYKEKVVKKPKKSLTKM